MRRTIILDHLGHILQLYTCMVDPGWSRSGTRGLHAVTRLLFHGAERACADRMAGGDSERSRAVRARSDMWSSTPNAPAHGTKLERPRVPGNGLQPMYMQPADGARRMAADSEAVEAHRLVDQCQLPRRRRR